MLYKKYFTSLLLTERTTKRLVWATWFLAIGTLILSVLTLYLTYFTRAT